MGVQIDVNEYRKNKKLSICPEQLQNNNNDSIQTAEQNISIQSILRNLHRIQTNYQNNSQRILVEVVISTNNRVQIQINKRQSSQNQQNTPNYIHGLEINHKSQILRRKRFHRHHNRNQKIQNLRKILQRRNFFQQKNKNQQQYLHQLNKQHLIHNIFLNLIKGLVNQIMSFIF